MHKDCSHVSSQFFSGSFALLQGEDQDQDSPVRGSFPVAGFSSNAFRGWLMTNRKFRTVASPISQSKTDAARKLMRQMLLESLEHRHLMAVGPQLIGIQPNNSDLLVDGAVRS